MRGLSVDDENMKYFIFYLGSVCFFFFLFLSLGVVGFCGGVWQPRSVLHYSTARRAGAGRERANVGHAWNVVSDGLVAGVGSVGSLLGWG